MPETLPPPSLTPSSWPASRRIIPTLQIWSRIFDANARSRGANEAARVPADVIWLSLMEGGKQSCPGRFFCLSSPRWRRRSRPLTWFATVQSRNYRGAWAPIETDCKDDKSVITLSAKAYVGPAGSCMVDYVSETAGPSGAIYSARLQCPGSGAQAQKKTIVNL